MYSCNPGLFRSVAQSCPTLWPHGQQHPRLLSPLLSHRVCSNSCPSSHLILCHPLLFPLSIFPSITVFSNESALCIRWPKYWSFSFSISPSNEYSGLTSFRMDCFDLLLSKGLSRVFSSTTVGKHQFFGAQSLWSNSHIGTWLPEKQQLWLHGPLLTLLPVLLQLHTFRSSTWIWPHTDQRGIPLWLLLQDTTLAPR